MIIIYYSDQIVWCKTVDDVIRELISYYGLNINRFMPLHTQITNQHETVKRGILLETKICLYT